RTIHFRPGKINREQAILEVGASHLDSLRQHERLLELARRDSAVEIFPRALVLLPAAYDELVVLDRDIELIAGKSGDRQRYAKRFATLRRPGKPFDVVGRVSVPGRLRQPVESALDLFETEQQRTGKRGD